MKKKQEIIDKDLEAKPVENFQETKSKNEGMKEEVKNIGIDVKNENKTDQMLTKSEIKIQNEPIDYSQLPQEGLEDNLMDKNNLSEKIDIDQNNKQTHNTSDDQNSQLISTGFKNELSIENNDSYNKIESKNQQETVNTTLSDLADSISTTQSSISIIKESKPKTLSTNYICPIQDITAQNLHDLFPKIAKLLGLNSEVKSILELQNQSLSNLLLDFPDLEKIDEIEIVANLNIMEKTENQNTQANVIYYEYKRKQNKEGVCTDYIQNSDVIDTHLQQKLTEQIPYYYVANGWKLLYSSNVDGRSFTT